VKDGLVEERERLITKLREQGFKITPQRLAIIELLEQGKHRSAEEIYKKLLQSYPMLSRATVYNTLEVLKQLGEIVEIQIRPNVSLYDPETTPHYHFLCRHCERVFDLAGSSDVNKLIGREVEGHQVEQVQVNLYGVCARCAKEEV
jgi:Fur family peroxide stress response transcriptional regulator